MRTKNALFIMVIFICTLGAGGMEATDEEDRAGRAIVSIDVEFIKENIATIAEQAKIAIDAKEVAETTKVNEQEKSTDKEITEQEEQEERTIEQPISEASGTYYVTASSLNIRSGGGTDYHVIGILTENSEVHVTGKTENGWYTFLFNDQQAFVSGKYLSEHKVVARISEPNKTEETNNNNVATKKKRIQAIATERS